MEAQHTLLFSPLASISIDLSSQWGGAQRVNLRPPVADALRDVLDSEAQAATRVTHV